jgi:predicted GNAT superfamily acetyltransferase
MSTDSVLLRRCHGIEDFRACVALQKEVWNFTDAELVPLRMFVVADKVGGQIMGAFDGDVLVGICSLSGRTIATAAWAGASS